MKIVQIMIYEINPRYDKIIDILSWGIMLNAAAANNNEME